MKRAAENDSSDDELFLYSNRQKLTFSSGVGLSDDIPTYSSFSDSSEDENDVVELKNVKENKRKNDLIQKTKTNKIIPDILSPPPPPVTPTKRKQRCTRKNQRAANVVVDKDTISLLKNKLNSSDPLLHEEDICIIEEISVMQLKIRVHGVVEKYEVKKSDQLKKLIADIASKEDVVTGHVTLNWGNASIDPEQTINSLGLTVADIVECVIHTEEVYKENMINIKIQSANKSHVYDITLNETVERVLKDFSEKCQTDITKINFSFDGERIDNMKTTFLKLDVMDWDVIDADLKS